MSIYMLRDCPECAKYLKDHSSLAQPKLAEMRKLLPDGKWGHVTHQGRMLHELVTKVYHHPASEPPA